MNEVDSEDQELVCLPGSEYCVLEEICPLKLGRKHLKLEVTLALIRRDVEPEFLI